MIAAMLGLVLGIGITGVAAVSAASNETTSPMEISFRFSQSRYTITINVQNGVVTPAGTHGVLTVAPGSDAVFSFTPNPGYHLQTVRVDGVAIWTRTSSSDEPIASTSFSYISADHELDVIFSSMTPDPTASLAPNPSSAVTTTAVPTTMPTAVPTARPGGGSGGAGGGSGGTNAGATASPPALEPVTSVALPDGDIPLAEVISSNLGDCIE